MSDTLDGIEERMAAAPDPAFRVDFRRFDNALATATSADAFCAGSAISRPSAIRRLWRLQRCGYVMYLVVQCAR